MAKFGFNFMTDEARDKLEELGISWKREGPTSIAVFTEAFDLDEDFFSELGFVLPEGMKIELGKKKKSQHLKVWKHKENGMYFYLIKDYVFYQWQRVKAEWVDGREQVDSKSVFDVVPDDEQGGWKDFLNNQPALFSGRTPLI